MLELDRLATERARQLFSQVCAEAGVPGAVDGELFRFGFAGLAARAEVMTNERPDVAHVHLTLSAPGFSEPVLDCFAGVGDGPAAALRDALAQWLAGPYWAYHDALAHDGQPTYELSRSGVVWHVFEALMQARGTGHALDSFAAAGTTRALLEAVDLEQLAPDETHRLRWVIGSHAAPDVFLDQEARPDLAARLTSFAWPAPLPMILRHSAVLIGRDRSLARESFNFDNAEVVLAKPGPVDVSRVAAVVSGLQHAIEVSPADSRLPRLCARWAPTALRARRSASDDPLDFPLSRSFMEAYHRMASGGFGAALDVLLSAAERARIPDADLTPHVRNLAGLFAERALPKRSDALINVLCEARERGNTPVRCATSSLEAPSAVAAALEAAPGLQILPGAIPEPDPRLPRSSSAIKLWSYREPGLFKRLSGALGKAARPALRPPSPVIAKSIEELASTDYSRTSWSERAEAIARSLGETALDELICALANPPGPSGFAPWDARFRAQVAAAFVISHSSAPAPESRAMRTLVGVMDGPVDWTTTAAAIALTDVALRTDDGAWIASAFAERLATPVTPIWYQHFLLPASWLVLKIPALPPETERVAVELLLSGAR